MENEIKEITIIEDEKIIKALEENIVEAVKNSSNRNRITLEELNRRCNR